VDQILLHDPLGAHEILGVFAPKWMGRVVSIVLSGAYRVREELRRFGVVYAEIIFVLVFSRNLLTIRGVDGLQVAQGLMTYRYPEPAFTARASAG